MKTKLCSAAGTAVCAVLLTFEAPAQLLYSDDFSSLTDVPNWTHLSAFALSTGQTWSAATGAYRMTASPNGFNPGNGQYGFVGSVAGPAGGNVLVSADVVAFPGPGANAAFGVAARLGNLATPLGLTGYAYVYEPFGNSGAGDMRLENLGPTGTFNSLGAQNVTLSPANQYTITLRCVDNYITGEIWQIGGGLIATQQYIEPGAGHTAYASGRAGFIAVTQVPLNPVDVTFDNFSYSLVPEPGTVSLLGLGVAGFLAWRRVGAKRS